MGDFEESFSELKERTGQVAFVVFCTVAAAAMWVYSELRKPLWTRMGD